MDAMWSVIRNSAELSEINHVLTKPGLRFLYKPHEETNP